MKYSLPTLHETVLWKYLQSRMRNFREKWEKYHSLTCCFLLQRMLLTILVKSKVPLQWHFEIRWPVFGSSVLLCYLCIFSLTWITDQNYVNKTSLALRNIICLFDRRFNNNSRNIAVIFFLILWKHVHLGWKFLETLKSSISFFREKWKLS